MRFNTLKRLLSALQNRPSNPFRDWRFCASLCLFSLLIPAASAWQFNAPPNAAGVTSDRRNNIFFVGEKILLKVFGTSAIRYTIRDYYGNIVEAGPLTTDFVSLKDDANYEFVNSSRFFLPAVTAPGWYKLYLHGAQSVAPWGDIVGGSMFVIFRNTPGFPSVPARGTTSGTEPFNDNVLRGVTGSGPARHKMAAFQDANNGNQNPTAADHTAAIARTIAERTQDIAQDKTYYTPFDPYRQRVLLGAFDSGTPPVAMPGVTQIVQHFQNDIEVWEGRNEPNFFLTGSAYAAEFLAMRNAIKSVNPALKVIGPGAVGIRPWSNELYYIQNFLAAGGGNAIDGFSFHPYNSFLGDPFLARKCMDELVALLTQYGQQNKERWQTEQGVAATFFGSFQPRTQGRWVMLMFMLLEQYGIPKEHNYLWYERAGDFNIPAWWVNPDGTMFPVANLLRVWAEELYGTRYLQSLDFGPVGNKLYLGSLFTGPGKKVAAIMSSGSTDGQVRLQTSDATVHVTTPFGEERDLPTVGGYVRLPVSELPTYVRFTGSLSVVPIDWGQNIARLPGTTVTTSGTGAHPVEYNPPIPNSPTKIINGIFENHYYLEDYNLNNKVWVDDTEIVPNEPSFPAWVQINLPALTALDRVVIYSGVPYQWDGTLLDYDLQYHDGTQWVTLQTVFEPTKSFLAYTQSCWTSLDCFFSERWVFQHSFPSVTTNKIRIFVRDCTWGGGATYAVREAGGWTGERHVNLREVEIYNSNSTDPANQTPTAGHDTASTERDAVDIRVLLNDSDTDSWPHPIRIGSVSTPAHGRAAIVGDKVRYTPSWNFTGTDVFTYTVTDGLALATGTITVSANAGNPPKASGWLNLKAEYFSDQTFTNLVATDYSPGIINFFKEWPQAGPYGTNGQNFGIRWSGQIKPAYTGGYTLTTYSDDRARVRIDGQLVIDDWVPHSPFLARKSVLLEAGRTYNVQVDYTEGGGNSVMQFQWSYFLQTSDAFVPLAPTETWRRSAFSTADLANLNISGAAATPAKDGISNTLKYAFALPPLAPAGNSSALPQPTTFLESGRRYLALTYRKNATATDLAYRILVTGDLASGTWDSAAPPEEIVSYDGANPIVRRRVDVTGSKQKFIRLEVQ